MGKRHRNRNQQPVPDEDRVEYARHLLGTMLVSRAKGELQRRYNVSPATAATYIRLARAMNLAAADLTRREAVAETLGSLDSIIHDHTAKHSDRCRAIRLKMDLLGLNAPIRVVHEPPLFDPEETLSTLKDYPDGVPSSDDFGQADNERFHVSAPRHELSNGVPQTPHQPDVEQSDR